MEARQVLFIQGGGDDGYEADKVLAASLKNNLGKGYQVDYPEIQSDETLPNFGWTKQIRENILRFNHGFLLVGHSFGASMILKYLSENSVSKIIEGDVLCGKGPSLAFGPAVHNKLLEVVMNVAERKKIPVQMRTVSRSTGTDTDSFAYANDGCPSVLISIPLRYMHTTVEMLHKEDIENTIRLMYETLLTLTPKTKLSYF